MTLNLLYHMNRIRRCNRLWECSSNAATCFLFPAASAGPAGRTFGHALSSASPTKQQMRRVHTHQAPPQGAPTQTVRDVISKLTKLVGASPPHGTTAAGSASIDRKELLSLLPTTQEELPPRTMTDSWDSAVIPLSTDARLREKYATFRGGVRSGRLLEDLDVFAVWLCYKHLLNPRAAARPDLPSPYTVVTAMVDRMDFCRGAELSPTKDIRLSGHVSWVGRSSLETVLTVDQWQDGHWTMVTRALFVMVARDPLNQGPALVNPLVAETAAERSLLERGALNKLARKTIQDESLFKQPPTNEEKTLVHELFMSMADPQEHSFAPVNKPAGAHWMEDTKVKNVILCHPESENIHGKIFGGFLMRKALELSYVNAAIFCKQRAVLRHIDDISFKRPVELGALLYLNSQIVYTEGSFMQVSTKASMMDPVTNTTSLTNIFHFTYAADTPTVPPSLPRTYHEAMMYLDGRRHFQLVRGDRRFYGQQEKPDQDCE